MLIEFIHLNIEKLLVICSTNIIGYMFHPIRIINGHPTDIADLTKHVFYNQEIFMTSI